MKRISRRNFIKIVGAGAAAMGLAACGGSSSSTAASTAGSGASSAASSAAPAQTIKVAAIETAYGSEMWQQVADAFTEQTGIAVELTTDKNLGTSSAPRCRAATTPTSSTWPPAVRPA